MLLKLVCIILIPPCIIIMERTAGIYLPDNSNSSSSMNLVNASTVCLVSPSLPMVGHPLRFHFSCPKKIKPQKVRKSQPKNLDGTRCKRPTAVDCFSVYAKCYPLLCTCEKFLKVFFFFFSPLTNWKTIWLSNPICVRLLLKWPDLLNLSFAAISLSPSSLPSLSSPFRWCHLISFFASPVVLRGNVGTKFTNIFQL